MTAPMTATMTSLIQRLLAGSVALLTLALLPAPLHAQQSLWQLPRTSQFRTTGSFFVPDSGATFSAGTARSSLASRYQGLAPLPGLGQRSRGGSFNRTVTSTTAQIYSLREMEAALLESTDTAPAKSRPATHWTPPTSAAAQAQEFNRRLHATPQPPHTRR